MKKFLIAVALLISVGRCIAQNQPGGHSKNPPTPAVSKGFWVVESNTNIPHKYVVYFYNHEQELIYQEKVEAKQLNVSRRKTQKQLNVILDKALANYAARQAASTDLAWVSAAIRK